MTSSMRAMVMAVAVLGGYARVAGADPSTAKVKETKDRVFKYAFEAYPSFVSAHPDKACPASFADLDAFMTGNPAGKDSWGHPLHMFCGDNVPPGARIFAVSSDGPDAKPNTPDDIHSW